MGTMSLLDVTIANNSEGLSKIVEECARFHPEFRIGAARTITGTHYKTLVRLTDPDVGFRGANEGNTNTKSTWENRLVDTFILDGGWDMDKAVADASEDGALAFCGAEAQAHMRSGIASVCKQFYTGTASGVTNADKGFAGLINAAGLADMSVNAGGDTADGCSTAWAVRFGPDDVQFVLGSGGSFTDGEIEKVSIADTNGKRYWAYSQDLQGWVGVQVKSKFSVGRIYNIDHDHPLTDDLLAELFEKFKEGAPPDMYLMSRQSNRLLKNSRTATTPTGAPAPWPTDSDGIRIQVTDSILNTEAVIS